MNGVIYARYSSDNQREESIEGQLRECMAFAEKNDITILNTYIDRAFSAKTDNRPEFQHMISDSKKKMFDVVLVWKYDRFARNRLDSLLYKQLLQRNNIKLISVTEPIMNSSVGIIVESMIDSYNEYYSAELAEKVIRGMTENALKCKYNGGYLTLGYYADDEQYLHVDPLYVPVILDIFTMYDEGATIKEIRNIKTKTKVCGCFRSRTGAEEYMGLMSFISTARKNGFDSYHAVKMVLSGQINQFFGVGC